MASHSHWFTPIWQKENKWGGKDKQSKEQQKVK